MQFSRAETAAPVRVGYTATKKLGNAVARNRARRRLKEAARLVLAETPLAGAELVLICRKETVDMPFETLRANLKVALAEVAK
jgi:ribonuclease P protein component